MTVLPCTPKAGKKRVTRSSRRNLPSRARIISATVVDSALVSDDKSYTVSILAGERAGSIDLNPNAPSNAMSAPRRTTTVAPGITPCSTASLKACSTSLHPNAQHLRQRQLPRNCRLSKNDSARGGINPRRHPERNRKILGAMPRLDAVQHRAAKTCSLLG